MSPLQCGCLLLLVQAGSGSTDCFRRDHWNACGSLFSQTEQVTPLSQTVECTVSFTLDKGDSPAPNAKIPANICQMAGKATKGISGSSNNREGKVQITCKENGVEFGKIVLPPTWAIQGQKSDLKEIHSHKGAIQDNNVLVTEMNKLCTWLKSHKATVEKLLFPPHLTLEEESDKYFISITRTELEITDKRESPNYTIVFPKMAWGQVHSFEPILDSVRNIFLEGAEAVSWATLAEYGRADILHIVTSFDERGVLLCKQKEILFAKLERTAEVDFPLERCKALLLKRQVFENAALRARA
jgi:hypothetical protein